MSEMLYLECNTGISGDMLVAALLDLGADQKAVYEAANSLSLEGVKIAVSRVEKAGINACDFAVLLDEVHENHDHDMAYLHGREEALRQGQIPLKRHAHRRLPEILRIIQAGNMTPGAKDLASRIFQILAAAEAKAHETSVDEVHFHEVGAVDSIVDIVSAAVCLDHLGIRDTVIPYLNEGRGSIRCQHGILPIPVPAVSNIIEEYRIPLHIMEEKGEFVTPTGAAIAAAIRTKTKLPDSFTVNKIGIGAGKRTYKRPSLLKAMLIEH